MNSEAFLALLIAILCLFALGAAAATLDSTVGAPDGSVWGAGDGDGGWSFPFGDDWPADRNDSQAPPAGSSESIGPTPLEICIPILTHPLVIAGLLVLSVGALVAVARRTDAIVSFALLIAFTPFLYLFYSVLSTCDIAWVDGTTGGISPPDGPLDSGNDSAPFGISDGVEPIVTAPPTLVTVLVVAVIVGLLLAFALSNRNTEAGEERSATGDGSDDSVAAVGRAAGRAADRIATAATVENEVYRSWREMTALLSVSRPESSTPGEFADAAVEAGMDRADVTALTDVFREVRYGGVTPDSEREQRAIDAFRRIEQQYADGEQ